MSKAQSAKPGEILTKIAIRVSFDPYFAAVLVPNYLTPLPRTPKKPPMYQVVQPLPQPEVYKDLRNKFYTTTVEDLVSSAKDAVEELANELRDWHSNLPPGIDSSSKADEIDEAASTLESISFPDIPEVACTLTTVHLPALETDSRAKRCAEACAMIENARDAIYKKVNEIQTANSNPTTPAATPAEPATSATTPDPDEIIREFNSFAEELESILDELQGVNFPSMM